MSKTDAINEAKRLSAITIDIALWSKTICKPESFNTKILHQLFDYTITFVNSQHKNTNSRCDFVLKNRF